MSERYQSLKKDFDASFISLNNTSISPSKRLTSKLNLAPTSLEVGFEYDDQIIGCESKTKCDEMFDRFHDLNDKINSSTLQNSTRSNQRRRMSNESSMLLSFSVVIKPSYMIRCNSPCICRFE